ncbi:hypothetical protein LXL04_031453 [Taraxacum kok-saghyz]
MFTSLKAAWKFRWSQFSNRFPIPKIFLPTLHPSFSRERINLREKETDSVLVNRISYSGGPFDVHHIIIIRLSSNKACNLFERIMQSNLCFAGMK